ncbi:MAG: RnfABCDGE type electron transport complex subunit D [Clostridia bacterium]|nr:RnfABCDGE type electron transport complex subunit D [Clostridia bacterium]
MNTFPLVRAKWSNEHVMAALFGVLLLYMLPSWVHSPSGILGFSAVLAFALVLDTAVNVIRFKRPVCAVSASVTAGIYYILTPGVPLWGQLLGVGAALLLGKHIWGGTGKNPVNPAMVGLVLAGILFKIQDPVFTPSLLLLPALILSIPFIRFRPFAACGFIAGMIAALIFKQEFGFDAFLVFGGIFWGCLVLTDPVTITGNPAVGAVGGILTGFLTLQFSESVIAMAVGVVLFNVISAAAERFLERTNSKLFPKAKINKLVTFKKGNTPFVDLTGKEYRKAEDVSSLSREEVLKRIEANEVFGLGGAAFPTIGKIKTVLAAEVPQRHLIINGVECDPGLVHDVWLMQRHMKEICTGIDLLKKCIQFESVSLAVKESTEHSCPAEVKISRVPDYYPIGAERILIRQVLGKEVPQNEIPAKLGVLVLNVQTVYAIFEAVSKNQKADSRFITVTNLKEKNMCVARVSFGANIQKILDDLGMKTGNAFAGGGAMQCRNIDDSDVIDKTVNFIALGDFPRYKESPLCSKCGFCKTNCPAGIRVERIAELAELGDFKEAKIYSPEKCIQCGNCSRICLAGRNLAARVKAAKTA